MIYSNRNSKCFCIATSWNCVKMSYLWKRTDFFKEQNVKSQWEAGNKKMRRQCSSREKETDFKGELGAKECFLRPLTFSPRTLCRLTSPYPALHGSVGAYNRWTLRHSHRDGCELWAKESPSRRFAVTRKEKLSFPMIH